MPETSLKQRIRKGEILIGVSTPINISKSRLEDILSKDQYAYVSVDSQHAPLNEESLVAFCGMANDMGVHVQLRIKNTRHTYLIGNYLDLGPSGVEVPEVMEEETADEALKYFYYPHVGKRSMGGTARVGLKAHPERLDYAQWWNNYGVLWFQIESVEATLNGNLLAKPGVDCLSFGPSDMSFSIEAHPNSPFQTVDDCVRHLVKQVEGKPTKICFRNYEPSQRQKYIDMGVTVLLERPQG
jgi:2-keto-3-deoxy-L-rhamnonate aldolase RhmA